MVRLAPLVEGEGKEKIKSDLRGNKAANSAHASSTKHRQGSFERK
jgi:hypothetical protein